MLSFLWWFKHKILFPSGSLLENCWQSKEILCCPASTKCGTDVIILAWFRCYSCHDSVCSLMETWYWPWIDVETKNFLTIFHPCNAKKHVKCISCWLGKNVYCRFQDHLHFSRFFCTAKIIQSEIPLWPPLKFLLCFSKSESLTTTIVKLMKPPLGNSLVSDFFKILRIQSNMFSLKHVVIKTSG